MKKILVIIGQHRSGTSMLSGSLNLVNGWLGVDYEFEADKYNSKGYFENKWIDVFNNKVLNKLGCDWHRVVDIPDNWIDRNEFICLAEELKSYLNNDLSQLPNGKFYILKDPRISLILPIYLKVFNELNIEPKIIFSDRKTSEILNSISYRDGLDRNMVNHAILMHREYAKKTLPNKDVLWTNTFYNMFYRPEKFLTYLKNFFELPIDISNESIENVKKFIDKGLKNQDSGKYCKVIASYFGPRRTNIFYHDESNLDGVIPKVSGPSSTLESFRELIENERNIDAGVFMDTIIVNHDISELLDISEAKNYLEEIDGTPTKNGVIKIINRPWNNGIGGSFASFDYVYQNFKEIYDYWFFTEDNVIQIKDKYFDTCIEQLKNDETIGFICGYRYTSLADNKHKNIHCHGGCGATHISKLNAIHKEFGHLPFSDLPYTEDMITSVKNGETFNSKSSAWYNEFQEKGEVEFTNVYLKLGFKLEDSNFDGKFSCYYNDCY